MLKTIYISYDGILEALGQSQILPYLKELSVKGIRFFLVSFEKKRYYTNISQLNSLKRELSQFNIRWFALPYHKNPAVLSTALDIFCGFIVCLFIVLTEKPKLVHARSYVASFIAWPLKKVFRLKFIFDMRGFWADERVEGKIWKSKNSLYRFVKIVERHLLKDADEIIVLTTHAKRIIQNWGYDVDNVSLIPSCVDTDYFRYNKGFRDELREKYNLTDKFIFVHTGSLEYWYMKDKMLDYFKTSIEFLDNVHFLILSHGEQDKLKRLIWDKDIDLKYFTILSAPFQDMVKYLSMADAGIFFITPVFSKLASSPTKFAEYLSCGLPVIVNDKIGDLEECILKNQVGVVIRNFCYDEYKYSFSKFLNLLKDEGLKNRCRIVAHEHFSFRVAGTKYYNLYSRLR